MSRTVIPVPGEAPWTAPAACYLLAYLEEERLCVYAPDPFGAWVGRQLPEAESCASKPNARLRRSGDRVGVLEVRLFADGERHCVRVLCVAA